MKKIQQQQLLSLIHQSNISLRQSYLLNIRSQPTQIQQPESKISNFLQKLLESTDQIEIPDLFEELHFPFIIKVLANILLHALENIGFIQQKLLLLGQNTDEVIYLIQIYKQNPLNLVLNKTEWQLLTKLVRKNQIRIINPSEIINQSQCFQDLTISCFKEMLIFEEPFNTLIFQYFHQFSLTPKSGLVPQISLKKITELLSTNQPLFSYHLLIHYSQTETKLLNTAQFGQGLSQMLGSINSYFKKGNMILSIIEKYKQQKSLSILETLFQKYIFLFENFQQLNKNQFIERIKAFFFESSSGKIDEKMFNKKCLTQTTSGSTLRKDLQVMVLYSTLIQMESQIIDHLIYQQKRSQIVNIFASSTDCKTIFDGPCYFIKQLQKMKSQCVNNGDQYCDCKKCQWYLSIMKQIGSIRRNRNSSKNSQNKKREALKQIGPLQENLEKLEKRVFFCPLSIQVHCLKDENNLLKGLLSDLFEHPAIEQIASKYAKQLKELNCCEQVMQKSYLTEC